MKIDKIKTFTFKFDDDGGFYLFINGKKPTDGGLEMPLEEHQKLARTLTRIALTTYAQIDYIINGEKEERR